MPNLYQDVPFSYATTNIDPNPYHPLTPVPYRRTTATSSSAITTAMLGQVFEDVDESHISSAHLFQNRSGKSGGRQHQMGSSHRLRRPRVLEVDTTQGSHLALGICLQSRR